MGGNFNLNNANDNRVLFLLTSLGAFTRYNPVFYRVYFEDENNSRKSVIVASKLAFLAPTVALSHKKDINKASIALITPITLVEILLNNNNKLEELLDLSNKKFCKELINKISKSIKSNISEPLIEKILIKNDELVIVDELTCEDRGLENISKEPSALPAICRVPCTLKYKVKRKNEKNSQDKKQELDLYIISVPLTLTKKVRITNENSLLMFRESNPDLNMESIMRASILSGVATALNKTLDKINRPSLDLTVIYDTSLGLNALLPPLTYVAEILDPLIILKSINRLFEVYEKNKKEFNYSISSYYYNSAPVTIRGEEESLEITAEENISYYYRKLINKAKIKFNTPSSNPQDVDIESILNKIAKIRGIIEEITSAIPENINVNSIENNNLGYLINNIFFMNLVKLGLIHWALVQTEEQKRSSQLPAIIKIKYDTKIDNIKKIIINYTISDDLDTYKNTLEPHIIINTMLLGDELVKYINNINKIVAWTTDLPEEVRNKAKDCLSIYKDSKSSENSYSIYCFDLERIKNTLKELINKRINYNDLDLEKIRLLLLWDIVEPTAKILIINELNRISIDKLKQYTRQFSNQIKYNSNKYIVLMPKPIGKRRGSGAANYRLRNFIAHAGLVALEENICYIIKDNSIIICATPLSPKILINLVKI